MAITVYGVDPSIDELHWARLLQDLGDLRTGAGVASGLAITLPTGTRLVNVASGRSIQAGTLAESTTAQNVNHDANSDSAPRIDTVCMQIDWTQPSTTAGSIVAVKGVTAASPVAPTLTRNPGVLFQTQVGRMLVRPGVTQFAGSDYIAGPEAGIGTSGWVTFTPAAGSLSPGWTLVASRYAVLPGGLVYLDVRVTRTGATITADAQGNLADTGVFSAGGVPASILPAADQSIRFSRTFFMAGTAVVRPNGALLLTDAYPGSDVTGSGIVISGAYLLG